MMIRARWMSLPLALISFFAAACAMAQTAPVINSFTVDQVKQVTPGTELIFRVNGSGGGALGLRIDGSTNQIGLVETRSGVYEGAYTISIRDKITYDSKVNATLRVGQRQTAALLGQTLLSAEAHAQALAAATPAPSISRFETKTTGALTGGNEITFLVNGTAGGKASVSLDGGKTSLPLAEEKAGHYSGNYTIKSRDQLTDATAVVATLALGEMKDTLSKTFAVGAVTPKVMAASAPKAAAAMAKCETCGVVTEVNSVTVKGDPNYVGAIGGGVAGAVLGSQVGKGDGATAATVIGAVGGALAGREIEKRVRSKKYFDVIVKLDNGTFKTARFEKLPAFKVDNRVKFNGETLVAQQ